MIDILKTMTNYVLIKNEWYRLYAMRTGYRVCVSVASEKLCRRRVFAARGATPADALVAIWAKLPKWAQAEVQEAIK
jgi:hypothetical protein